MFTINNSSNIELCRIKQTGPFPAILGEGNSLCQELKSTGWGSKLSPLPWGPLEEEEKASPKDLALKSPELWSHAFQCQLQSVTLCSCPPTRQGTAFWNDTQEPWLGPIRRHNNVKSLSFVPSGYPS